MIIKRSILLTLDKENLVDLIIRQAEMIESLQKEQKNWQQWKKEKEELIKERDTAIKKSEEFGKRIEELERSIHRSAAPFRVKESRRKKNPNRPGRKDGHAGAYRKAPEHIDENIEVPLSCCPKCGGEISDVRALEQIIEEIPPVKPRVYKLTTYRGQCKRCGKVQSHHPLKCSDSTGAAAVQIGPYARSIGMELLYKYGLSKRKTVDIMTNLLGLSLTAGGWVHASHRMGQRCEDDYQQLVGDCQRSEYIHSDETSWYVGGPKAWLWVFTNETFTVYKVADNRSRATIHGVIGLNYPGVLISDCLNIYDDVNALQQKCYSHHLKAVSEAEQKLGDEKSVYLQSVRGLLKEAMALKKAKSELPAEKYENFCRNLEAKADELLQGEPEKSAEVKVTKRLKKQRDHLFTFLYKEDIDATNNLAERQLRPAVIARKVSCGNKTAKGAHTWEVLTSMLTTLHQRNQQSGEYFKKKAAFDTS